ncbi:MAG: enoyl-CoA hydratase/isomerase family protein [Rhodobacteraceae bacterium]|jgi:3-hydroxyacyl-CoA dehydrogenase/enoyl-CoA hydratase/3-hydroxybutyryl-CoA epimerase|nr:enoyl-CoA hydratase/isomerase family protein [Paracoccaceae bacterium]
MPDFRAGTEDGIRIILWDVPGRSMNVLGFEGLAELAALVDEALADPAVTGIVLTSAKPDFAGGMDLAAFSGLRARGPAGIFAGVMAMHALLRRIERGGADPAAGRPAKPVVAALTGTAAGAGYELALACHRIIAADGARVRIGLPEIRVGLFPGAGGTTRLSRRLGAMAAAPFLLEGRMLAPAEAQAAGLVDEVAPAAALLDRAREWIRTARPADLVKPWDTRGWKMPGGAPYSPEGFMTFVGASAMVNGRTQGCYPAARGLLAAVYEGALVPFDVALRIEARHFTAVLTDPTAEAMIRTLFLNREALEKGAVRPAGEPDRSIRRLGVIGAGMMGAGIARVAAEAGIAVVLIDSTPEAAAAGRARLVAATEAEVARGKLDAARRDAALERITPGAGPAALAGADLVIEAVFEDPEVKARVLAEAAAAAPEAVIATNTSTLPVSGLAAATGRAERFLGIHFFSPVEKMALVEVIRGRATGARAVATALDFVRQLRKTPIVVNDARFFYANRCIIPYVNEGVRLVAEGVAPALVENAARALGMPVGPLQLIDETSIDLGVRIARATRAATGAAYPDAAVDAVLFPMAAEGRLGRKAGAGFYDYDARGRRTGLWPGLAARFPRREAAAAEVRDRLLLVQVLEAVRALEAGVLDEARAGDVGAVLGWGFAPWSGGPFAWIDRTGAAAVAARAAALAARHGPRFAPPGRLVAMAASGARFYPD